MVKNKFTCSYDDMEGYLIEKQGETIEDSEVFLVTDRKEAEEITEYLNKQLEIIEALKEDSYSNVDVIRMKQELDEMIEFHNKRKHERIINNLYYDILIKLRRRWFG